MRNAFIGNKNLQETRHQARSALVGIARCERWLPQPSRSTESPLARDEEMRVTEFLY